MSAPRRAFLVAGVGIFTGCTKVVKSADEVADVARRGDGAVSKSDEVADASRGDDVVGAADDAEEAEEGSSLGKRVKTAAKREAKEEVKDEAKEQVKDALFGTEEATPGLADAYEADFEDEMLLFAEEYAYWSLPFGDVRREAADASEDVFVSYTVSTDSGSKWVDVFVLTETEFANYERGAETWYVSALSEQFTASATASGVVAAQNYYLVVDNTSWGETPANESVTVTLDFSSVSPL